MNIKLYDFHINLPLELNELSRDATIVSLLASVVSAIFQCIGIGTLKFSPMFADTDTFIFFNREILIKIFKAKYENKGLFCNSYCFF